MSKKKQFDQRVVWITGGGTGIGEAMALEFARRGAFVAVSGRRTQPLEAHDATIRARAHALIASQRATGAANTIEAFLQSYGLSTHEGKLLNKEVAHDLDMKYTDPTSLLA